MTDSSREVTQRVALPKDKVNDEIGKNYRYNLRWRHLAFLGQIVVIGTVGSLSITAFAEAKELMWLIPLCASPIGIFLWMIDKRIRDIYGLAIKAGRAMEGDVPGFYTSVETLSVSDQIKPRKKYSFEPTHTTLLKTFFLGTSLILFLLAIWFFGKWG